VAEDDDAALMTQVARGDRLSFATLFDRHWARVVRFCRRFTGSEALAEEAAQEVFVKLYRSAGRYRPTAKFTTFLFRVATNHCLNELRRGAQAAQEPFVPAAHDVAPAPERADAPLEAAELQAAVVRALDGMSDRERAAFSLCRFEGLPYADIAQALEASEAAVKSLIHRATLQVMHEVQALAAPPLKELA